MPQIAVCLALGVSACTVDPAEDSNANTEVSRAGKPNHKPASDARIDDVMGDIAVVEALESVVPNESEDDMTMLIFQEQRAVARESPLGYDLAAAKGSDSATEVHAGTTVNVYFVHFDPVGRASKHFSASIVFPDPILGVAFRMKTLDAGDAIVGRDDVTYPEPDSASERGLEYPGQDKIAFEEDAHALAIDLTTSTSSDQVRVITAVAPN